MYGRGTELNTVVKSPVYESKTYGEAPYLDAVMVMNEEDETLVIFMVNKSLDEDMELSCNLRQFAEYHLEEHVVMIHENMKAVNTESDPYQVAPTPGTTVKFEDGKLHGVLGKHSWNMIRLEK